METRKKEVVRSIFYLTDIKAIFEYGEASFGEKAALTFFGRIINRRSKSSTSLFTSPRMPSS